jgi:hypothetical protein
MFGTTTRSRWWGAGGVAALLGACIVSNMTGMCGASHLRPFRKFRRIADGYEPVDLTSQLREANDPRSYEKLAATMRRTSNLTRESLMAYNVHLKRNKDSRSYVWTRREAAGHQA